MGTEIRQRILAAAAKVYAETGYRGATTRRIAQEAGVNEITLFRHFGSKDALIQEALQCAGRAGSPAALPDEPRDPEAELTEWCRIQIANLNRHRALIRMCLGETAEHPEIIPTATSAPACAGCVLYAYLERLQERGMADRDVDPAVASAMLLGSMFADAMARDVMPDLYPYDADSAPSEYVKLFLRAIGARRANAARRPARRPARKAPLRRPA